MTDRGADQHQMASLTLGAALIASAGLMFALVFVALYPVVRDPVATYDRWFPVEEPTAATSPPAPQAAFSWQTVSLDDDETRLVEFVDESTGYGSPVVAWEWVFGDGATASGRRVEHTFANPGNYTAQLTATDANGMTDAVGGRIVVRNASNTFGDAGRMTELLGLGGDQILGDLGGTIADPLNDVVDSVGDTARGGVVVALFGLAALGIMMIAWRVGRLGAMLVLGVKTAPRRRRTTDEPEELRLISGVDG